MNNLQSRIQRVIDGLVESGAERGLQVAVYRHGELLVDAVAGLADAATGRMVTADTPFNVHSTGKGVTATITHILAERGLFGYDTPIVELWPEFGAHGKGKATVRHALTHTVGVPSLPADTTIAEVCDWDRICAIVADMPPSWEPGTKTGYHAYTFGFVLGEIVRRATGKPIAQVLREEVGVSLGIADEIFFGMPEAELGRIARLEDAPGSAEWLASLPEDSEMWQMAPRAIFPNAEFGNRADVLMASIPAGGKMTARAVARMYAALLGEVDGVRLISPDRLREVSAVAFEGDDALFGNPATWALGYSIGRPGSTAEESPTWFGMVGAGGSCAYADTASGFSFAVAKNRLTFDLNAVEAVVEIVAEAAGS
ncbi:MAG: serine hydrolase domain-containing protein [Chloroflexia bacterium]